MQQHTIDKMDKLFADLVTHEMKYSDEVYLATLTDNRGWEFPIPDELTQSPYMSLVLTGWSKEQSYCTENGIYIVVAFGENENSKHFLWSEIKGIFLPDGTPLMVKPYDKIEEEKPDVPERLSLKDIMHNSEGVKRSMKIMRKLNPKKGE